MQFQLMEGGTCGLNGVHARNLVLVELKSELEVAITLSLVEEVVTAAEHQKKVKFATLAIVQVCIPRGCH